MSRHRNIRNLKFQDYDDGFDDYDDYEEEQDYDPQEYYLQAYNSVVQVLGTNFNKDTIYKWLEKYDGNVEKTISKLLDCPKESKTNLNNTGNATSIMDTQDGWCMVPSNRLLIEKQVVNGFYYSCKDDLEVPFSPMTLDIHSISSIRLMSHIKAPMERLETLEKSSLQITKTMSKSNLLSMAKDSLKNPLNTSLTALSRINSSLESIVTGKSIQRTSSSTIYAKKNTNTNTNTNTTKTNVQVNQLSMDIQGLGFTSNEILLPVVPPPKIPKPKKNINIELEIEKRRSNKERLNLVVIGHVDSGKSTLFGHLLVLLGKVQERQLRKFEKESEEYKKGSFYFAWVLDESESERSRGVTIDVAVNSFETSQRKFTLLDAPGHVDFIPNMISGATQADVALLVIDASIGGFEAGFHLGGQTREHAILVKSLGVSQLIVAINKMDTVNWSESRFNFILDSLLPWLKQIGFKKNHVFPIPVSGFKGENLLVKPDVESGTWYDGPTLVQALDALQIPTRDISKPFRMPINDVYKEGNSGGVLVDGRIESGTVKVGDQVCVRPLNEYGIVKDITLDYESVDWSMVGDHVQLNLSGLDMQKMSIGDMLCDPTNLVPVVSTFIAQVLTLDLSIPLTLGMPVILYHQQRVEPGRISKLLSIYDKTTGDVIQKNPRFIRKQTICSIEIQLERILCIERFDHVKELGRVTLRVGNETLAIGKVISL